LDDCPAEAALRDLWRSLHEDDERVRLDGLHGVVTIEGEKCRRQGGMRFRIIRNWSRIDGQGTLPVLMKQEDYVSSELGMATLLPKGKARTF
jgi:hypothetical protein